ncbi:MAG: type III polyketide synthase [Solirubrobacterales bacterium]
MALATAVPAHELRDEAVAALARQLFGGVLERVGPVHANSGVHHRYSCVAPEWYLRRHGWAERARLFARHATDLAARATIDALARAGLSIKAVDAIVAVSTTGVATPSLDALLIDRLGLRPDVVRLPIFGLGCAGGVLGLARAGALARAMPGANVLLVVVELCGLTFRVDDRTPANVVATALFGDGCAAAVLSTRGQGPRLSAWADHTWPDTLEVMGWRIEDDGFGVLFSRDIPAIVTSRLRPALDGWLSGLGLTRADIDGWACHPGGAKVVTALEEALGIDRGTLADERAILASHGNMSAATVLFVLARRLAAPLPRRVVATALGPGFTAGFLLLEGP